jgi:Secretion system C-terminal sorting domain
MEVSSMLKLHRLIFVLCLIFGFSALIMAQNANSVGRAPLTKQNYHITWSQTPPNSIQQGDMGFGWEAFSAQLFSNPMPAGQPLTDIIPWNPTAGYSSSATRGGDLNYYFIDPNTTELLMQFDPVGGTITQVASISGVPSGCSIDGLAYDWANGTYYVAIANLASLNNLYTFDISTGVVGSTPVVQFPSTGGMIGIAFTSGGVGYGYDLVDDNSYSFDVTAGTYTILGPLGFDANFAQDMDINQSDGTIWLEAYNNATGTAQLRTMDPVTGATTLMYDYGAAEICAWALNNEAPCGYASPSNPNPPNGSTGIPVGGTTLTWDNGAGATSIQVWFGPTGNMTEVYNGSPITTYSTGPLIYYTNYSWQIVNVFDTCNTLANWGFMTEQNPNYITAVDTVFPQNAQYWTGNTDGTTKYDNAIDITYPKVAWAAFDISSIPSNLQGFGVDQVTFYAYANSVNDPFWSITPMGSVNPVTDDGATINAQIQANYDQTVAYLYCVGCVLSPGPFNDILVNGANTDMENAVTSAQGYFAVGALDWDFTSSWWIVMDGYQDANPPYLVINYHYVTPVELASFTASANDGNVTLNWATATETNNRGFQVERKAADGQYQDVAFIDGHGTTTQPQQYSYVDKNVTEGNYTYRLKQTDFDGTSVYSKEVEVGVKIPAVYSLKQNYPNPFNPSTKIDFTLASDSHVTLNVYDVLGRKVAELMNTNMTTGLHTVNFNATRLASGVYFYKLEAKGMNGKIFTSVKKMMLTK